MCDKKDESLGTTVGDSRALSMTLYWEVHAYIMHLMDPELYKWKIIIVILLKTTLQTNDGRTELHIIQKLGD